MVKRLLLAALAAWVLRWAVLEVVAYAARHWLRPTSVPAVDPERPPGRMPTRFD
jgi:hypothetical protein